MAIHSKLRILLTALVFVGMTAFTMAQFSGGGRLGVNFSNLRGSSISGNSMLIGYNIGGFVNYRMSDVMTGKISEIMSLQTELTIQSKGATADYASLDANAEPVGIEAEQNFTYAEIPLLARFTFTPSKKFSYFGEAGVFLGALVGVSIDGENSWNHDLDKTTDRRKYRQEYSGFDFGVALGAGASMPFGGRKSPWAVFANIRGAVGLMNIGEEKGGTPDVLKPYLQDVKTGTLSLAFGVAYKF